jgi:hypothetical protein
MTTGSLHAPLDQHNPKMRRITRGQADVPKLLVRLSDLVFPISRLPVSVGDGQDSNH